MTAEIPAGQLHGEFAAAPIERSKARWDKGRSLTVFHDEPPRLGPYPRAGHDRVTTDQVLIHLLTEPNCPSLDACDWLLVSHCDRTVPTVEFRVHTRDALELWAGHFQLQDGREFRMSNGKLDCQRWGNRTIGGRLVDIKVTGTLEKAS